MRGSLCCSPCPQPGLSQVWSLVEGSAPALFRAAEGTLRLENPGAGANANGKDPISAGSCVPFPPAELSTENQPHFSGSVQGRELELGMFPRIFPFLQQNLCPKAPLAARCQAAPGAFVPWGGAGGCGAGRALPGGAGGERGCGGAGAGAGCGAGRGPRGGAGGCGPPRASSLLQEGGWGELPLAPGYHCPTAIAAPSPTAITPTATVAPTDIATPSPWLSLPP